LDNNNEPKLGLNYLLAFVLSMAVLLGYPYFLRMVSPPAPVEESVPETKITPPAAESAAQPAAPLQPAEGPFIEKAAPPAVVRYKNNLYEAEFSTRGAGISRLVYFGEHGTLTGTVLYEGDINAPGFLAFRFLNDSADLASTIFKLNRSGNDTFDFVYENPGEYRIVKRYHFDSAAPVISLEVMIDNLSSRERHFPAEISAALAYENEAPENKPFVEAVALADKIESAKEPKIYKKGFLLSSNRIAWAGTIKKYFAVLIKPEIQANGFESRADGKTLTGSLRFEPVTVLPGGKAAIRFAVFAGPQKYETLKSFGQGFEEILSRGFFGIFKFWLLMALKFLFQYIHNFGWGIILLTLLIKGAFTPLSHMSFESMKRMQALQPKVKSLQERYKNDPTKQQKEMMELYRRNKVNPMMGCLPMVMQIPIFIAFYQVLNETVELQGAPFIGWITDLSQPDRLFMFPAVLPFIGDSFHLLPILMIGSMIWQQKLQPQTGSTPEQTQIMQFMPIIFGFLFYKMPSGLVLYWLVNNMLSIVHQTFVKRMVIILHHEDRD